MGIKKGDWYKCIKTTSHSFIAGRAYVSTRDGSLQNDKGYPIAIFGTGTGEFQKLYTIQDLKDRKVAVDNTKKNYKDFYALFDYLGEDLLGSHYYFFYREKSDCIHFSNEKPYLPTQSVKDFIVQLPKEYPDLDQIRNFNFPPITEQEAKEAIEAIMSPINPKHYSFNIKGTPCDLFDIGNAMDLNKEQFTALRYFRKKENQIEDTKKAIKCLERLVERLEAEKND